MLLDCASGREVHPVDERVIMQAEELPTGADVVETPMPEVLEALAGKLEEETAASLESLRQQAARLREETAATVAALREQAARLRDERDFSR